MTADVILAIACVSFYGLASIDAIVFLLRPGPSRKGAGTYLAAAAAACLATILAVHALSYGSAPVFGRFDATACYVLAVTLAYLHMALHHQTRGISAILLPFATVMLVVAVPAVTVPPVSAPAGTQGFWLGVHVLSAFAGYALFTLASILAVAYLIQDCNLKHKMFGVVFERLPALETLDDMMCRQIMFAFLMLTVSMVSGSILVHFSGEGSLWLTDPKVAATMVTWMIYAILLHMRTRADRHGRKIAMVTIAGLFCILFTFFGVHLLTESVHDFVLTAGGGQ